MTALVHRFTPSPFGRHGRIELDIDPRQARLQYRAARVGARSSLRGQGYQRATPFEARALVIHTFVKAVDQ